jgi:glutathione S-transferase
MIKMYGFIPAWGLPDVSPFVSKTDAYLRMSGIPIKLETLYQGDLTKTPKGKLPVIDDDGVIISDTVLIELYLKQKYGLQFFHSGKGRNIEAEVEQSAYEQIDALSDFLGDKPCFMGARPGSADAAVYASLSQCMLVPVPSPIGKYANAKPNLLAYVNRIHKEHYMEFDKARAVRG